MPNPKYVFFGSPEFAAIILRKLISAGYPPEIVICNPDRPVGRKKILTAPATKSVADAAGIKTWQPEILFPEEWAKNMPNVDFGVVAAYAKIIKHDILNKMPMGVIGVHPSLLPKYRGPSPIQTAILHGETETGLTLYLIDEKMDHGPILAEKKAGIEARDTAETLLPKLAETGAEMLLEIMPKLATGRIDPLPQNEDEATFTKKFTAEDAFINPEELISALEGDGDLAEKINNMVRAFYPEPGAWTYGSALPQLNIPQGKRVKILSSRIQDGKLKLKQIQLEGERPRNI